MSGWQKKIGAITLFVEDPERSKAFYQEVFDLEPDDGGRNRGGIPAGGHVPVPDPGSSQAPELIAPAGRRQRAERAATRVRHHRR